MLNPELLLTDTLTIVFLLTYMYAQSCTRVQIFGPDPTRPTEIVTQPDATR